MPVGPDPTLWEGTVEPGREARCTGDLAGVRTLLEGARAVAALSRILVFCAQASAYDPTKQMNQAGWLR